MKFLYPCPADATADLVYRACPMHLLEPMELIKDLQPGQVLEILTDYDGALEAIPAWCAKHGQEFLGISEDACERNALAGKGKHPGGPPAGAA